MSPGDDPLGAKGLRENVVMRRHALRAALPPVLGQFLGELGHLPSVEVIQALILVAATLIAVTMRISDLLHARLDPQVRTLR